MPLAFAQLGQTLGVRNDVWEVAPPLVRQYQWLRNGEAIEGATAQTYELQEADFLQLVAPRITVTNAAGTASTTVTAIPIYSNVIDNIDTGAIILPAVLVLRKQ